MITLISTTMVLMSMAGSADMASTSPAGLEWRAEVPSSSQQSDAAMSSLLRALNAWGGESPWAQASRTVFVVPGPDLPAEGMARISEDMAIMCRILDKAMAWANRAAASQIDTTVPPDISGIEIAEGRFWTQGLYLDGQGAIFFLPVGFPLVPPAQEPAAEKSEPSKDPLWSQTADELRGVPQEPAQTGRRQYDAQKVENLKAALIAVLRHAANLRTRGPQDAITIVLSSRAEQPNRVGWVFRSGRWDYQGGTGLAPQQAAAPGGSLPDWSAVLILRTTKGDVDAFAKGDLSPEQFTGKVQVLKSWMIPALESIPTGAPQPVPPVAQPQQLR